MGKIRIALFVEDSAQERFVTGIIKRILAESGLDEDDAEIESLYSRGGKSLQALKTFVSDLKQGKRGPADILVVGSDANCLGLKMRRKQIDDITRDISYGIVVLAIPSPHIERWYLLDLRALKDAVDSNIAVTLPAVKCEKGLYKELLKTAFRSVGIRPPLGGSEYGELIAGHVDIYECGKLDRGFKLLIDQLRQALVVLKKKD